MGMLTKVMGVVFDLLAGMLNIVFRNYSDGPRAATILNDAQMAATMGLWTPPAPSARTAELSPAMWQQAQQQITALQKADPNFAEIAFLTSAAQTYVAARMAESASSSVDVAGMVTPDYAKALQARIDGWRAAGETRIVNDLKIDGSKTFNVSIDADQQNIEVRFTGSQVRCTQDGTSGAIIEGSRTTTTFSEFATFVRPAGSTTGMSAAAGGPVHCPSCGAPLSGASATCQFCGAAVGGGGAPWLLNKISTSAYT